MCAEGQKRNFHQNNDGRDESPSNVGLMVATDCRGRNGRFPRAAARLEEDQEEWGGPEAEARKFSLTHEGALAYSLIPFAVLSRLPREDVRRNSRNEALMSQILTSVSIP